MFLTPCDNSSIHSFSWKCWNTIEKMTNKNVSLTTLKWDAWCFNKDSKNSLGGVFEISTLALPWEPVLTSICSSETWKGGRGSNPSAIRAGWVTAFHFRLWEFCSCFSKCARKRIIYLVFELFRNTKLKRPVKSKLKNIEYFNEKRGHMLVVDQYNLKYWNIKKKL